MLAVAEFPRALRGWTEQDDGLLADAGFPASAGVDRVRCGLERSCCTPRTRGGEPSRIMGCSLLLCSPRVRGWTEQDLGMLADVVFPASAGVYRAGHRVHTVRTTFPRTRGDAPSRTPRRHGAHDFPPYTRGCTEQDTGLTRCARLSPHRRACTEQDTGSTQCARLSPHV